MVPGFIREGDKMSVFEIISWGLHKKGGQPHDQLELTDSRDLNCHVVCNTPFKRRH